MNGADLGFIEWAACTSPVAGEVESGDRHVVATAGGQALLAVIDGLGHGRDAAHAAIEASAVLGRWSGGAIEPLIAECHQRLRGSRGVVVSVAVIEPVGATLTWLGVGNVEGVLVRAGAAGRQGRESLLLRSGVVGYQIPRLQPRTLALAPGDLVVLATDGIVGGFTDGLAARDSVQDNAERVFAQYRNAADDALVLVASYRGIPS